MPETNMDLSPRENVLDYIGHRLCEARDHTGTDILDIPWMSIEILDFIEARALAREPEGGLLFLNPDHPTGTLDHETGIIDPV